jgi:hypothetical protein
MPGCHGQDRVKDRQAWCTEPASYTRTWGMFTMGRPERQATAWLWEGPCEEERSQTITLESGVR